MGATISNEKHFKDGCDLSENDSDYTPSIKKSKMKQGESNENFKYDAKKRKGNTRNDIKLKIETNGKVENCPLLNFVPPGQP